MPTVNFYGFADGSVLEEMLKDIRAAKKHIYLMTFLFNTTYDEDNLPQEFAEALKEADKRGVRVCVLLNYCRSEPDVREVNYRIGAELAAAGCEVRLGPKDVTLHTKMMIVDDDILYLGSHNITRGAMKENREFSLRTRSRRLLRQLNEHLLGAWNSSTRISEFPPPWEEGKPVRIMMTEVTSEGNVVRIDFKVNHHVGVETFIAVVGKSPDLDVAKQGSPVFMTERAVAVVPDAVHGGTIYVAVCAYRQGEVVASSNILQMAYRPGLIPSATASPPAAPSPAPQVTSS